MKNVFTRWPPEQRRFLLYNDTFRTESLVSNARINGKTKEEIAALEAEYHEACKRYRDFEDALEEKAREKEAAAKLPAAEARLEVAEARAAAAERRAEQAEERAAAAERRAEQAEERAAAAKRRAEQAEARLEAAEQLAELGGGLETRKRSKQDA